MVLIAPEDLRSRVRFAPNNDEEVDLLLAAVTGQWEQMTGRPWLKETTGVYDYIATDRRQRDLWIPNTPVTSVLQVSEREEDEATFTVLAIEKWHLASVKFGRVSKLRFPWRPFVQLVYAGGHDQTTVPEAVKSAIVVQIRFMRERLERENLAVKGRSARGGTATFLERADHHPLFVATAKQYRRKP